mgnify:CR=1 FL=1
MREYGNNGVGMVALIIVMTVFAFKIGFFLFNGLCTLIYYAFVGIFGILVWILAKIESFHREKRKNKKNK